MLQTHTTKLPPNQLHDTTLREGNVHRTLKAAHTTRKGTFFPSWREVPL